MSDEMIINIKCEPFFYRGQQDTSFFSITVPESEHIACPSVERQAKICPTI